MEYSDLNEEQKAFFKEVCDKEFGPTNTFVGETKEPLYFDKDCNMVPTEEVIKLLFSNNLN